MSATTLTAAIALKGRCAMLVMPLGVEMISSEGGGRATNQRDVAFKWLMSLSRMSSGKGAAIRRAVSKQTSTAFCVAQ